MVPTNTYHLELSLRTPFYEDHEQLHAKVDKYIAQLKGHQFGSQLVTLMESMTAELQP